MKYILMPKLFLKVSIYNSKFNLYYIIYNIPCIENKVFFSENVMSLNVCMSGI